MNPFKAKDAVEAIKNSIDCYYDGLIRVDECLAKIIAILANYAIDLITE